LADQVPRLALRIVDEFRRQVPFYALQPPEVLDGPVRLAVEANLRMVVRTLRQCRAPSVEEQAEIISWSARRAEEGVPLEAALAAYHLAIEVCWRAAAEEAGPADAGDLQDFGLHLLGYLRSVVPAVTLAHVQEQQQLYGERREARQALVTALLNGDRARGLAVRAGVALATEYTVVVLRLGGAAPEPGDVRPLLRALETTLNAHARSHVLASFDENGGTILLPGSGDHRLEDLVALLGGAAGRPATAAHATAAAPEEIPAAADEAREVAALVVRLRRPPGLYRIEDVLLEYQLSRPGHGLAKLAAQLDAIRDRPDLMETLRAVAVHGNNRRQAALDLHVHRNTLDYRLRRIAALTGLDPADPDASRLLAAALTALDLTR
jgi:hypothetical protein